MMTEEKSFTSCTSELKQIRDFVESTCANSPFSSDKLAATVLAVDEACANVIRHGYDMDKSGCISLVITLNDDHAVFTVKDTCSEISDHTIRPKKKSLKEPGGLGLHLIHTVAESVRLVPHEGCGNWLELIVSFGE